jgi:uncharacterized membrane protein YozB (DUF420 family)
MTRRHLQSDMLEFSLLKLSTEQHPQAVERDDLKWNLLSTWDDKELIPMDGLTIFQINLAFQIIILAILITALALSQKHKNFLHGLTMLIAVMLNIASFLTVMLPSLFSMEIIRTQPSSAISLVTFTHAAVGVVTMVLGLWLVASWHLQSSIQSCATKKKVMRLTAVLWSITLILGILLYMWLYTNLIPWIYEKSEKGTQLHKSARMMIIGLSILFTLNLASPSFAIIPQIKNVVVYESGGSTYLNITVYHSPETSSHYVNIIEVTFNTNTTHWNIDPQPLSPDSTFNVTYDVGPVAGNPTATVRAHCTVDGWSNVNWSGPIPEFQTMALVLLLLVVSLATLVVYKVKSSHW